MASFPLETYTSPHRASVSCDTELSMSSSTHGAHGRPEDDSKARSVEAETGAEIRLSEGKLTG